MRAAALALGVLSAVLLSPHAQALEKALTVGGHRLELAGHGTRTEMWFIALYRVALYLPRDMSDPAAIQAASLPKALRVQIRYNGSLPDKIPEAWRDELLPALTRAQQGQLRHHYRRLVQGDVVTVSYAPGTGTTVSMNGTAIIEDDGHALMHAFLDLWIGQHPVSQELKQSLLS